VTMPVVDGAGRATGWFADNGSVANGSGRAITVYVICAKMA